MNQRGKSPSRPTWGILEATLASERKNHRGFRCDAFTSGYPGLRLESFSAIRDRFEMCFVVIILTIFLVNGRMSGCNQ